MKASIKTEQGEVIIDTEVIAKYAGGVAVEIRGGFCCQRSSSAVF